MKQTLLFLLVLMGLLSACKSSKAPEGFKGEKIVFGTGGGFTGMVTTYTLQSDGHLYKQNSMGDTARVEVNRLAKSVAKPLMKEAATLPKDHFQQPGNMYSFLEWNVDGETYRVTWGDPQGTPPAAALSLFRSLMEKVNPEE